MKSRISLRLPVRTTSVMGPTFLQTPVRSRTVPAPTRRGKHLFGTGVSPWPLDDERPFVVGSKRAFVVDRQSQVGVVAALTYPVRPRSVPWPWGADPVVVPRTARPRRSTVPPAVLLRRRLAVSAVLIVILAASVIAARVLAGL